MGRPSKYPPEFRAEAVELVRASGGPRVEVARSLGISGTTLAKWVRGDRDARTRAEDPGGLSESERVELTRLRRRTPSCGWIWILRKAAAYFARETMR